MSASTDDVNNAFGAWNEVARKRGLADDAMRAALEAVNFPAIKAAATALYMAGRWRLPDDPDLNGAEQARMWEDLRDALGLTPGTATAAGVGAQCTHGCPRCDDAMECDCEPPPPFDRYAHGDGSRECRPACAVPPEGWRCTRGQGHSGPCAAVPNGADPRWRPGSEL